MEGNIVTAAKWLGAAMILSSAILAGGLHCVLSSRTSNTDQPAEVTSNPAIPSPPQLQGSSAPGDLQELAKAFHSSGTESQADPKSADPPQSLFGEPTLRPEKDVTAP